MCSEVSAEARLKVAPLAGLFRVGAGSAIIGPATPPVVSCSVTVPLLPPVTEVRSMVASLKVTEMEGVVLETIGTLGVFAVT